ncbi:SPOR domain-containing protein [Lentibacter algarum]|uniref:SPOR domain-containing protein n=1 Tax=Lentibacter algarum TaxID=576131 RepID=UPI001C07E163|nr:SPOR domain-containing protein [Lentibacter algarum]MBU2982188.1 SPOR domain-containing protein [Lentibacter algarum]
MADFPLNGSSGTGDMRQSVGTATSYAGAIVSLVLVVGVGAWGYNLLARDVSGVPVVQAASDGPMRVVPENPGGDKAAHQGLSVNIVMAEGGAEKPADKLTLAPSPVELIEEDTPLEMASASGPVASVATADAGLPELELDAPDEPLSGQMASIKAFADQLANGVAPLEEAVVPEVKSAEAVAKVTKVAAVAPVDVSAPVADVAIEPSNDAIAGLKSSLRPKMRPVLVAAASQVNAPAAAATASDSPVEVEVANVAVGTRLVQLGAFDSPDVAREEWTRLSGRFEDYMDDKQRVVMRAKSGGRVFYRLRAMGFADLSDARRFCAALVAEKVDCIPVVSK